MPKKSQTLRKTEGVNPTKKAQKNKKIFRNTSFFLPKRDKILLKNATNKEMCIPETANK